jgi:anti-sigma-K factor RskA
MNPHEPDFDCVQRADAAAYVLGALEGPEPYREHLSSCATCQAEVARLQLVADALPSTVPSETAPRALIERVLVTVRSEAELLRAAGSEADRPPSRTRRARSRRVSWAAAGLAFAASLAVAAALTINSNSSPRERVSAAEVAATIPGAHAWLHQIDGHASLVVSGMPQAPTGKIYEVWLGRAAGSPQPTSALFGVTSQGSGSTAVPDSLHGVKEVLVTSEPLGGSAHPTSPPLLRVVLPA